MPNDSSEDDDALVGFFTATINEMAALMPGVGDEDGGEEEALPEHLRYGEYDFAAAAGRAAGAAGGGKGGGRR